MICASHNKVYRAGTKCHVCEEIKKIDKEIYELQQENATLDLQLWPIKNPLY